MIIVTRHQGLVEWLASKGITGDVISHATAEDVQNQDVIGALPLHLAALTNSVTVVDLPGLRPDQRGKDLTPAEMDQAGARLATYLVAGPCQGPNNDGLAPGSLANCQEIVGRYWQAALMHA